MTAVISQSLYPVQAVERRFWHGNRYHCVSAKVTLAFDDQGRLSQTERQPPMALDEVWHGTPMRSSLRHPGDLIPYKPVTDLLVTGTARPPGGRAVAAWDASIGFQGRSKRLRLTGPRAWEHRLVSGWTLGDPSPTDGVALLYENAFGGVDDPARATFEDGEFHPANPFGTGFVGRRRPDTDRVIPAPQIEAFNGAVGALGKPVAVGGLGPIPGFFPDRARHMGTWDGLQPDQGMPLDMDMHYWNCAPADQQADGHLREGDEIELRGLAGVESLVIAMPGFTAMTVAHFTDGPDQATTMRLDTVEVDLDRRTLGLRYHRIVAVDERMERISVHCAPHRPLSGERLHG